MSCDQNGQSQQFFWEGLSFPLYAASTNTLMRIHNTHTHTHLHSHQLFCSASFLEEAPQSETDCRAASQVYSEGFKVFPPEWGFVDNLHYSLFYSFLHTWCRSRVMQSDSLKASTPYALPNKTWWFSVGDDLGRITDAESVFLSFTCSYRQGVGVKQSSILTAIVWITSGYVQPTCG